MPKHTADAPDQQQYPRPSVTGGSPTVDLGATEGHAIQAVHEQTQSMLASFQAMMEDMMAVHVALEPGVTFAIEHDRNRVDTQKQKHYLLWEE